MRTKFEFDFVTTATPDQVVELMTDFSPNRVHRWPVSSAKAFEVYHVSETEGGSAVHGDWEQTSKNLTALIGVTTMRIIGPRFLSSYFKRSTTGSDAIGSVGRR